MNNEFSNLKFSNLKHKNLSFNDVCSHLLYFVEKKPDYPYKLSVGSDSQVKTNYTVLVSAIHLHRVGNSATGFITKHIIDRKVNSLREKIFYETYFTMNIAYMFSPQIIDTFIEPIIKSKHGKIDFEFHLDIGTNGSTKNLIKEMLSMANIYPFTPKIKPESYAASSYADKYTKKTIK